MSAAVRLLLLSSLVAGLALARPTPAQTAGQAVDRSAVDRSALDPSAIDRSAAPSPIVDPRVLSDADRRAYAGTLREARDLIDRKQYDGAIAALDRLTAAHPREPQARFMKGVAQTDAGKGDDAIGTFRALLADFPELPEPRNNLAVLYAQRGDYALARTELEIALKAAPDYAVAHENLADVYARLAATHYERSIALDPRNKTAAPKLKLVRDVSPH